MLFLSRLACDILAYGGTGISILILRTPSQKLAPLSGVAFEKMLTQSVEPLRLGLRRGLSPGSNSKSRSLHEGGSTARLCTPISTTVPTFRTDSNVKKMQTGKCAGANE